ncbi:hypothetical protein L195_g049033, partial [Trifolium pratense]
IRIGVNQPGNQSRWLDDSFTLARLRPTDRKRPEAYIERISSLFYGHPLPPRDEWNDWLSNISANSSVTIPYSILMEFDSTGDLFCYPGGFSHSVESGAGKRRGFAIGNYVNQRLLRPLQPRNEAIFLLYDHRLKLEDPPEIVLSLTYLDFSGSTNPRRDKSASDQASSQDRSPFKPTYKTSFH